MESAGKIFVMPSDRFSLASLSDKIFELCLKICRNCKEENSLWTREANVRAPKKCNTAAKRKEFEFCYFVPPRSGGPRVIPILPELYEILKATPRAIRVKCQKCGKMQSVQTYDCGEEI